MKRQREESAEPQLEGEEEKMEVEGKKTKKVERPKKQRKATKEDREDNEMKEEVEEKETKNGEKSKKQKKATKLSSASKEDREKEEMNEEEEEEEAQDELEEKEAKKGEKTKKQKKATKTSPAMSKEDREDELKKIKAMLDTKDVELHKPSFGKIGSLGSGSIAWEVEAFFIGKEFIFSPPTSIEGVPFRIGCRNEGPQGTLVAALFCADNKEIKTDYAVKADIAMTLASRRKPLGCSLSKEFTPKEKSQKWSVSPWQYLVIPANGVIDGGRFFFEATIKVGSFYKNADAKRHAPSQYPRDVDLLVGGKKFPHNKECLAHFSGFFKALFPLRPEPTPRPKKEREWGDDNSDYEFNPYTGHRFKQRHRYSSEEEEEEEADTGPKEVDLPDVDPKDFEDYFLGCIAPITMSIQPAACSTVEVHQQRVKPATVVGFLRMADRFDIEFARMECTKFLLRSNAFSRPAKLLLSDQYKVPELQYEMLKGIETRHGLSTVINSKEFASLSEPLQTFLLQKYVDLPH